ncbi:MAG: aminotransferase class V-fold PLP-dependent enzyme [Candidatus Latescibacteria bacterium]|nr:aminotransferase class V-fold PLP-dependent enzyme [Candidatus Latescibacterota bacterium]NIO29073.1 aminotransferase class V-fold PLP-dependent enzyme [Candidatus Latescibacterota bacterium]NIO56698.1 aminotransferase class V-fold PLP-dependent enzyme [Candidatus Latescibacterota bacterium]NIT02281.1 aminotransferase class V-fold PLP-dependent enzyme [Candidatus Latescibacterota bacterium]NIT39166.1 aminotransferase class V-fold PLP-dependent enzyme [Candidatus Latescibacterota bacterium]
MAKLRFDTIAVKGGFDWDEQLRYRTMAPPIVQSAVFPYESAEYAADLYSYKIEGFAYGRINNPTNDIFEKRMALLEGGEAALATASGMAAVFMVAHHLVKTGEEITSSIRVYGGTFELFNTSMPRMGIKTNWVLEPDKIESWEQAITPKTKLLHVESPSNPNLFVADIPAIVELAKSKGIPLMVDNTICTPALMRPIEMGADIIIHSATKYISGNATSLSGAIVAKKEFVDHVRHIGYRNIGPSISPFNSWLCLLGLESLSLRMKKHSDNAMAVAKFLEEHPKIESVNYPGLPSHPQHDVAKKTMSGYSSMMSFNVKGGLEATRSVIDNLSVAVHTTHLGSSQTVAIQPAATTHWQLGPEERAKAGIPDNMIRYSAGLEDPDDLIEDLDKALSAA